MRDNIASFFDTQIPIFIPENYKKKSYVIVAANSCASTFAKYNFPNDKLIHVPMYSSQGNYWSEKKILYSKEMLSQLKKNNISHINVTHRCSKIMKNWAKKNNIRLIGTPYNLQQRLENKIYFDSLLKKNALPSPPTLTIINNYSKEMRYVV